jgi:antitoxin component of RelBE/YafQ-DinJ toxin-antitoxin module
MIMAEMDYATIRVHEEVRDQARVTKAELGVDWNEYLTRATRALDEETDD